MKGIVGRFNFGESELSMMKETTECGSKEQMYIARILGYTDPLGNPKARRHRGIEESTALTRLVISTGQSTSSCYIYKRTRILILNLLEQNGSG